MNLTKQALRFRGVQFLTPPFTIAGVRSVAFFGTRTDICLRLVECSSKPPFVYVAIRSENFREAAAGFVIEDACVVAGKGYGVRLHRLRAGGRQQHR